MSKNKSWMMRRIALERFSFILLTIIILGIAPSLANLTLGIKAPPLFYTLEAFIDGPDTVYSGDPVTLTGGYSQSITDDMTNATMESTKSIVYEWNYLDGPQIDSSSENNILTFTAPRVDTETQLTYELIVTTDVATGSTSKSITVMPTNPNPCQPGYHTEGDICVPDNVVIPPATNPNPCQPGYHSEVNICVPDVVPRISDVLTNLPLPLWLVVTAGLAVVIIPIAVYLPRRHRQPEVPFVLQDKVTQRTPKNTIEIVTEGGIE